MLEYSAKMNSFFTIQYETLWYSLNQLKETVPSGESYLVQIDPNSDTNTKNVYLLNQFYKNKNPFLANFFGLNCEFEVKREDSSINFFNGYGQEILNTDTNGYNSTYYIYRIKIIVPDTSNYNHKMCMLYISGYEAETKFEREIVIAENTNQHIIFKDNFKKIRYLYPHSDSSKDLVIHVNVIDKAFYKINIFINDYILKESTVTRTQIFYLGGSDILKKCEENTLCPIIVEAIYDKQIIKKDPMLEISVRKVENSPTYVQKQKAKLDFVYGSRFYYLYTDIGKSDFGEITVNFLRGFGNVWGKIVKKDQNFIDDDANWRGIYRMPSTKSIDLLPFDDYSKTLFINIEDTRDCIEGCYLLISIQIAQIFEESYDYKFYPFSIITQIFHKCFYI